MCPSCRASETNQNGNTTANYTTDENGTPVSVTKNNQTYYYHYNGQGDVVSLTDSSGSTVTTYTYDAWGNITNKTGTIDTPFTYRGKYGYIYDKETGLYFLQSRYYDPQIGRFTSKDRFEGFDERPLSQNPYVYCENDPVNNVDPDGWMVQAMFDGSKFTIADDGKIILSVKAITGNFKKYGWGQKKGPIPPGLWLIKYGTDRTRTKKDQPAYGPKSINLAPVNPKILLPPCTQVPRDQFRIHSGRNDSLMIPTIGCIRMKSENVQRVINILKSVKYDIPLLVEYPTGSPYKSYVKPKPSKSKKR